MTDTLKDKSEKVHRPLGRYLIKLVRLKADERNCPHVRLALYLTFHLVPLTFNLTRYVRV